MNVKEAGLISHKELLQVVKYDPVKGLFAWVKQRRGRKSSLGIGSLDSGGYLRIAICGKRYSAHRLAWFYVHAKWPTEEIDHVNRERNDNRIMNLRQATVFQNRQNRPMMPRNTSGIKGVKFIPITGKWGATIDANLKKQWLGTFATCEQAGRAYQQAAKALHGEFGSET